MAKTKKNSVKLGNDLVVFIHDANITVCNSLSFSSWTGLNSRKGVRIASSRHLYEILLTTRGKLGATKRSQGTVEHSLQPPREDPVG